MMQCVSQTGSPSKQIWFTQNVRTELDEILNVFLSVFPGKYLPEEAKSLIEPDGLKCAQNDNTTHVCQKPADFVEGRFCCLWTKKFDFKFKRSCVIM